MASFRTSFCLPHRIHSLLYAEDHLVPVYKDSFSFRTGRLSEAFTPIMTPPSLKFTEKERRKTRWKVEREGGKGTSSHPPLLKTSFGILLRGVGVGMSNSLSLQKLENGCIVNPKDSSIL